MAELFESGRVVDLILALMMLEAVVLIALARAFPGQLRLAGLLYNLAAGACLLLALRAVLSDAGWLVAGAWLALALVAHLADLNLRLRPSRN